MHTGTGLGHLIQGVLSIAVILAVSSGTALGGEPDHMPAPGQAVPAGSLGRGRYCHAGAGRARAAMREGILPGRLRRRVAEQTAFWSRWTLWTRGRGQR